MINEPLRDIAEQLRAVSHSWFSPHFSMQTDFRDTTTGDDCLSFTLTAKHAAEECQVSAFIPWKMLAFMPLPAVRLWLHDFVQKYADRLLTEIDAAEQAEQIRARTQPSESV